MPRVIVVIAALLSAGCASTASVVVAPPTSPAPSRLHALDIRLTRVDIDDMPMFDAFDSVAAAVRKVYGDVLPSWAYAGGGGTGVIRVTFHGGGVTVRQVLDEFCRQTSM